MEQSRIQQKINDILLDIKAVIKLCKEKNYVNEQWFINFEDELNKYSGIDYTVTEVDESLLPKGTAKERLNKWLQAKDIGIRF